jgi:hypothetical protein
VVVSPGSRGTPRPPERREPPSCAHAASASPRAGAAGGVDAPRDRVRRLLDVRGEPARSLEGAGELATARASGTVGEKLATSGWVATSREAAQQARTGPPRRRRRAARRSGPRRATASNGARGTSSNAPRAAHRPGSEYERSNCRAPAIACARSSRTDASRRRRNVP